MAFLRALVDATPLSVLLAVVAFVLAYTAGQLPPAPVGVLTGVVVLAGATGVSHRFQTEERRYPLTRVAFELLYLV